MVGLSLACWRSPPRAKNASYKGPHTGGTVVWMPPTALIEASPGVEPDAAAQAYMGELASRSWLSNGRAATASTGRSRAAVARAGEQRHSGR
jgi:hypothetical protein